MKEIHSACTYTRTKAYAFPAISRRLLSPENGFYNGRIPVAFDFAYLARCSRALVNIVERK